MAHHHRLSVSTVIANIADEHRGLWRFRLRRLAKRIGSGTSLVDALEQTPDVLRDQDVLALRFASQTGTLTQTYEQLLRESNEDRRQALASIRQLLFYAVIVGVVIVWAGLLLTLIRPQMELMADEFEVEPPWAMRSQADAVQFVANLWPLWLIVGIGLVWSFFSLKTRRWVRRKFSGLRSSLGLSSRPSELLQTLSLAIAAGRPVAHSLSTLARYHFDTTVRDKLLFVRNEIEQGTDVWESLRDAKLLTPAEADAIRFAPDKDAQVWILRQLGAVKSSLFANRYQKIAAWSQPLLVLLLGGIVFWMSSGQFHFLTQVMRSIRGWQ